MTSKGVPPPPLRGRSLALGIAGAVAFVGLLYALFAIARAHSTVFNFMLVLLVATFVGFNLINQLLGKWHGNRLLAAVRLRAAPWELLAPDDRDRAWRARPRPEVTLVEGWRPPSGSMRFFRCTDESGSSFEILELNGASLVSWAAGLMSVSTSPPDSDNRGLKLFHRFGHSWAAGDIDGADFPSTGSSELVLVGRRCTTCSTVKMDAWGARGIEQVWTRDITDPADRTSVIGLMVLRMVLRPYRRPIWNRHVPS